jgi:hypothetical protein
VAFIDGTCDPAAGPGKQEQGPPPHCQLARSLRRLRSLRTGFGGVGVACRKAPVGGASQPDEKEFTMSKPAHKIRIGVLQVTIWRNTGEKGPWYSVTPTRSYKQDDDTWRETDSLGFDDLLTMGKLFELAHTWIMHQMQADAKARKESEKAAA